MIIFVFAEVLYFDFISLILVKKKANNKQKRFNRKLLSLKSNAKLNNDQGSIKMLAVWLAVGTVLTLIVVLAMCACHKNDVEK